jgi:cyclic beta-1,2-glucan synthetase
MRIVFLRSRRTWLCFERFVSPDDHWLPTLPGAVRRRRAARRRRTSARRCFRRRRPTSATSVCRARRSLRDTLATLGRLERYRAIFSTGTTRSRFDPLEPQYVSTVDGSNSASLLAVKEGCIELARGPALPDALWQGFADVLGLLLWALERLGEGDSPLRERIARLLDDVAGARRDPLAWQRTITRACEADCPEIARLLAAAVEHAGVREDSLREVRTWLERTHHHARAMQRDL